MKERFNIFILYLVIYSEIGLRVLSCKEEILPETPQSHSVCFGTHRHFRASCEHLADTVIAIQGLCVGSKVNSTGCPSVVREDSETGNITDSDGNRVDTDTCCNPDAAADCIFPYQHPLNRYHVQCNGLPKCTDVIPASQADTSCVGETHDPYLPETSYMFMQYACIFVSRIGSMFSAVNMTTTDGKALYLQNPSYPGTISSSSTFSECSIQTDECNSNLYMYTVDVHLMDNDLVCNQGISINTTSGHVISWTCNNHTLYNVVKYTFTDEQYLLFSFNNSFPFDGGQVWVGFTASSGNLMINCPPVETVACVNRTTPSPPTTLKNVTNPKPSNMTISEPATAHDPGDNPEGDDSIVGIVIGVVAGVFVMAVIVGHIVAYIIYIQKHRNNAQVAPAPQNGTGVSNNSSVPDTANPQKPESEMDDSYNSQPSESSSISDTENPQMPENGTGVPEALRETVANNSPPQATSSTPYWLKQELPSKTGRPEGHEEHIPPIRGIVRGQADVHMEIHSEP